MKAFALLPAEQERIERERVQRFKPHLAFPVHEPKPEPPPERDYFAWISVEDVCPVAAPQASPSRSSETDPGRTKESFPLNPLRNQ